MVVVGFDSRKDTLAGCAIDEAGRPQDYRSFANTAAGHAEALEWVGELYAGRVAIEGSGSYGRPLALVLLAADRARRGQCSRHKSDPGDALP